MGAYAGIGARNVKEIILRNRVSIRLPEEVGPTDDRAIDSTAATWSGKGISLLVDEGPFADPLTSYENRPNYRAAEETIGGRKARVVAFDQPDGTRSVAAHFPDDGGEPGALTVVARGESGVAQELLNQIIRDISFA